MSIDLCVVGIRPPDEKWLAMKKVYDACMAADIDVPDEVDSFFDGDAPDDGGVIVHIEKLPCVKKYHGEYESGYESGYEIDITKLPKDIKIIRCVLG